MMNLKMAGACALALTTVLSTAAHAQTSSVSTITTTTTTTRSVGVCAPPTVNTTFSQFSAGSEFERRKVLEAIIREARTVTPSYDLIRSCADHLQLYYDARAGRQQTFLNVGTLWVLLGTTGAALSTGAGATTHGYWTGGALAPNVISQFEAYEPTRDLFHSGAATLHFISRRYDEIRRVTYKLRADWTPGDPLPRSARAEEKCAALEDQAAKLLSWPDGADRTALQPEVERLVTACRAARQRNEALATFRHSADLWESELARLYADDVANLDAQVRIQDRALRYTPQQALSSLLASPFLVIGSVLSNEDAKGAIESLKAQAAIQSLKVPIAAVPVVTAPALAEAPEQVSAPARVRASVRRTAKAAPNDKDVVAVVRALEQAREGLVQEAPAYNQRAELARQIALAARTWSVSPRYDPQTRAIRLVLTNDGSMFEVAPPQ